MKNKNTFNKLTSALLAATLALGVTACGATADTTSVVSDAVSDAADVVHSVGEQAAAQAFSGDGYDSEVDYLALAGSTIRVAASAVPHAEILKVAAGVLAQANITLDIIEFTDYVQPNMVTENGEVDANYFQHILYLDDFNAQNGTHLVNAAEIHYEPLGIYPGKTASLDALADGAQVAVPNDTTNEARALQLLAAQGLLTLKDGAGLTATKNDIVENPKNLEIVEMEAAQLPRTLQDVDLAVINGNYAAEAGFNALTDALALEDSANENVHSYTNVLVVREGNEDAPATKALAAALKSQAVKDYITESYDGAVVAVF